MVSIVPSAFIATQTKFNTPVRSPVEQPVPPKGSGNPTTTVTQAGGSASAGTPSATAPSTPTVEPNPLIQRILNAADFDQDGSVTQREYASLRNIVAQNQAKNESAPGFGQSAAAAGGNAAAATPSSAVQEPPVLTPNPLIQRILNAADLDQDGSVTQREYSTLRGIVAKNQAKNESAPDVGQSVAAAGTNAAAAAVSATTPSTPTVEPNPLIQRILNAADLDQDGTVTQREYASLRSIVAKNQNGVEENVRVIRPAGIRLEELGHVERLREITAPEAPEPPQPQQVSATSVSVTSLDAQLLVALQEQS